MPYNRRFCTQCGERLLFEDGSGRLTSESPVRKEGDLVFASGGKVRIVICEKCLGQPDFDKILESILHEVSSVPENTKIYLQGLGRPIHISEAVKY